MTDDTIIQHNEILLRANRNLEAATAQQFTIIGLQRAQVAKLEAENARLVAENKRLQDKLTLTKSEKE